MNKKDIAAVLEQVADLLDLKGENPFKSRAYRNAARIVGNSFGDLEDFVEQANRGKVKGLGPATREAVDSLFHTGEYLYLEELKESFPDGLLQLFDIPGLAAKKVGVLYKQLEITSISQLKQACLDGKLAELKGFGEKTQQNILKGIEQISKYQGRFRLSQGLAFANQLIADLKKEKSIGKISLAGSIRRSCETIKDIDLIATSSKPEKAMNAFVEHPLVEDVSSKGDTKSSVRLKKGISVDLRVVETSQFASTLAHFTGSKDHNTVLRGIAKKKGLKLNEYGLFKGDKLLPLDSEEDLYKHLGLAFVPPEVRENTGEVEQALKLFKAKKKFPKLVVEKDIKGIVHAHTTYSDGKNTLKELALEVKGRGYQYLGVSDHSQAAAYANGLKEDAVKRQWEEIDKLNEKLAPFRIFKGIESDILADGSLDYPDKILEGFEFIIASIHSRFTLPEKEMTARIIRAVQNPYTTIIGHLSGRLVLKRDAYQVDQAAVIEEAAKHNVALELNANPRRLDLDWRYHALAKKLGVSIPICPDAHSIAGLDDVKYGVGIARKGWLEKENILNCLTAKQFDSYLKKRRQ